VEAFFRAVKKLRRQVTQDLVIDIAQRIREPEQVLRILENSKTAASSFFNNPISLANGYSGLILLFSVLDDHYPGEKWDFICHHYVLKIKEIIETQGIANLSLFEGIAGCAFAIQHASKEENRYKKLLIRFNEFLFNKMNDAYFFTLQEKFDLGLPIMPNAYDLMSGICGIGLYTLKNLENPQAFSCLQSILKHCINLTHDIKVGAYVLPGWYAPKHYQFTDVDQQAYPKGNFNLGLAHGISGPLAFLSIAALHDIKIEGQLEAIKKITSWLFSKRKLHQGMNFWPNRINFEEEALKQESTNQSSLEAWCYGTPGVARALYLAGKALNDDKMQKKAVDAFYDLCQRPYLESFYSTSSFCHGTAGLLTLTQLMVRDTNSPKLDDLADTIEKTILNFYDSSYPMGFKEKRSLLQKQKLLYIPFAVASGDNNIQYEEMNQIGLLDGIAGILLALISKKSGCFSWTFPLLIEGKKND
jgi:lantibiotic biosynthesis protein